MFNIQNTIYNNAKLGNKISKNISCVMTIRHYQDQDNCNFDLMNLFDDRQKLKICSHHLEVIEALINQTKNHTSRRSKL